MILITSAAYISQGLRAEFGALPPSLLPVQNRRLYEHQVGLVSALGDMFLTLPRSFDLPEWDWRKLSESRVGVVCVPDGLRLGESVVYALNVVGRYGEPLYILHGDTLFDSVDAAVDTVYVSQAQDDYTWDSSGGTSGDVYAGFFSFSSQTLLIRKIVENDYNFIKGVEAYGAECTINRRRVAEWMDFGLVNSYYRSTSKLTTQRAFNALESTSYSITKRSRDTAKILAEARWFENLPSAVRHYAPTVWRSGEDERGGYYEIEYYYLSSLANLYVYGHNPLFVWNEIFDACDRFLTDMRDSVAGDMEPVEDYERMRKNLYGVKTRKRLNQYCDSTGTDPHTVWRINGEEVPSLIEIVEETERMIERGGNERYATIMHGDFCLSNILYDFKSKSIRVIDPRGLDGDGHSTIYGDQRYDVAKLAHSVVGMYDLIIGGRYEQREPSPYEMEIDFGRDKDRQAVQELFLSRRYAGHSVEELSVYPIMIHLFLSMLPLHGDRPDRQRAMLANALRLYCEMKKKGMKC